MHNHATATVDRPEAAPASSGADSAVAVTCNLWNGEVLGFWCVPDAVEVLAGQVTGALMILSVAGPGELETVAQVRDEIGYLLSQYGTQGLDRAAVESTHNVIDGRFDPVRRAWAHECTALLLSGGAR